MRNYYIFHPSVSILFNYDALVLFRDILHCEKDAYIIMENPQNLITSKFIYKDYAFFYNRAIALYKISNITHNNTIGLISVVGQSCYTYAKELIQKKRRICFVGFPHQQLRSLLSLMTDRELNSNKLFAILYCVNKKQTVINLKNGKEVLYSHIKRGSSPGYSWLKESDSYFCSDNEISQITLNKEMSTPHTNIFNSQNTRNICIIKSTRGIDFDYIERNSALIKIRTLFLEKGIAEALPQCFVKDKINVMGVMFNNIEGFSMESIINEDAHYEDLMYRHNLKPCFLNKLVILINLYVCAYDYHCLGIYFSDIKPDNFIINSKCEVIPIDTDGFSISNYTSSRPRPEYMDTPHCKVQYYQTHDNELYSLLVLTYTILVGTQPEDRREQCRISHVVFPNPNISYTPAALALQNKWKILPDKIKRILEKGLIKKEIVDTTQIIRDLILSYTEECNLSSKPYMIKIIESIKEINEKSEPQQTLRAKKVKKLLKEIKPIRA